MKSRVVLGTLTFSAALIGSGAALAQQHDTRAQVQPQLVEANRTGSILSGDGTLWRDLGDSRYLAGLASAGTTREQVRADLAEANRKGAVLSGDGTLWRDLGTPRDPADTALAGKTREQVQAELAEANRTGTILSGDGTLWQDLGALHRLTEPSFFARTDTLSGMPVTTGTFRATETSSR
jgi:hypothetical protein